MGVVPFIAMVLISILSTSSGASYSLKDLSSDQIMTLKRNYVALEGKRRPIYNFGIGKRHDGLNVLERSNDYDSDNYSPLARSYLPESKYKRDDRISRYNFGLGKRAIPDINAPSNNGNSQYSPELRIKYPNENPYDRFIFGSSNRIFDDQDDVQQGY